MSFYHILSRKDALKFGLKRYFTGIECANGHICERRSSGAVCVMCSFSGAIGLKTLHEIKNHKTALQKVRGEKYYKKNKKIVKDRSKKWKAENPDKLRESWSKWRKKDTSKSITFMRDSLRRVLKIEKKGRTEEILGYTRSDLIKHIEKQFLDGMTWDNHGEWHIDHITPISVLLSSGVSDPSVINCLSNLKPIWAKDNLSKSNKVEYLI